MKDNLIVTILGCGSSGGVPRVGGDWGACDPNEPKNRRSRCSILVEYWQGEQGASLTPLPENRTAVLIDTSPDLREQLLAAKIEHLDAVLFTHEHADQTHGIDDLRALAYRMRSRIPTYMDTPTKSQLMHKFGYCFEMPDGRVHPPILEAKELLKPGKTISIDGPGGTLNIGVHGLSHGPTVSLGFTFAGAVTYTPDVHDIDDDTLANIQGTQVWIVDALRYNAHPTHAHADKSLSWIAQTQTQRAVLTNMHIDMDYRTLTAELPESHIAAYDGMMIMIEKQ